MISLCFFTVFNCFLLFPPSYMLTLLFSLYNIIFLCFASFEKNQYICLHCAQLEQNEGKKIFQHFFQLKFSLFHFLSHSLLLFLLGAARKLKIKKKNDFSFPLYFLSFVFFPIFFFFCW